MQVFRSKSKKKLYLNLKTNFFMMLLEFNKMHSNGIQIFKLILLMAVRIFFMLLRPVKMLFVKI